MKIIIIEPFFTGSHTAWAEGYAQHSEHAVEILSLPGRFWKWRMHGGAVTLAKRYHKLDLQPDLILATDMLNLPVFLSLVKPTCPVVVYFHENQFTYPWSPNDEDVELKRDKHYGFINYSTVLCADHVFFNSQFHLDSFFDGLENFLRQFPDYREMQNIEKIQQQSTVLHLGLDLKQFYSHRTINESETSPLLLWNHRWEHDKNPEVFFETLHRLSEKGLEFKLAVLGEGFQQEMPCFTIAREKLNNQIVQFGFTDSFEEYASWLWKANILPVTSNQDFFGASIMEAVYCNTLPLLPQRLTYPELFNKKKNPDIFYNDYAELELKLEKMIQSFTKGKRKSLSKIAASFDWNIQSKVYDKIFEEMF